MQIIPIDPSEFARLYVVFTALAPIAFGALSYLAFFAEAVWAIPVAIPLFCITPLCSCVPCLPCCTSIPFTWVYLLGVELFALIFGLSPLLACCTWGCFLLPSSPLSCVFAIPASFFFCIFLVPLSVLELIFLGGTLCPGPISCCTAPGICGCGPCFAIPYDICGIGLWGMGIITGVATLFGGLIPTLFALLPWAFQLVCVGSLMEACNQQATTIFQSESICEAIEIVPTLICSF